LLRLLSLTEEEQRTLLLVLTYVIPRLEDSSDPLNRRFHRRLVQLCERVEALDRAAPVRSPSAPN
jgi:hypothetical protein